MKKMISIRFDDRTLMLLNELARLTGSSLSLLVRALVMRSIDELVDDNGNIRPLRMENEDKTAKQEEDA